MHRITTAETKTAEVARNHWIVQPEHVIPAEELLVEETWTHVAAQLRTGDRVDVLAVDMSYFVELLVIDAGPRWGAKMHLLKAHSLEPPKITLTDTEGRFSIKFRGRYRYCVIRKSDGNVMAENMTAAGAKAWIEERESTS